MNCVRALPRLGRIGYIRTSFHGVSMRLFIPLLAVLSLSGCVSKSAYLELEAENERLHERMEKLADANLKTYRELMEDFKPLIDANIVKLEVKEGRITLGMAADVLFPSGSAELTPEARNHLVTVAASLKRRTANRDFQVEGHTDSDPISTAEFPTNWHLGAARAISVVQFLTNQGFPTDHISAASFGDKKPVANNSSGTDRARNRRIEIVLLPDLSDMPGSRKLAKEAAGEADDAGKGEGKGKGKGKGKKKND